jgi:hypothetical protein
MPCKRWIIHACPCAEKCSAASWARGKISSWESSAEVSKKLIRHLMHSGHHGMSKAEAEAAALAAPIYEEEHEDVIDDEAQVVKRDRERSRSPRHLVTSSSSSSGYITVPRSLVMNCVVATEQAAMAASHSVELCSKARAAFEQQHLQLTSSLAALKGYLSTL